MRTVVIEVYGLEERKVKLNVQARYLVRSHNDVLWTDDLDQALMFAGASMVLETED
jgi:hypothetical protein